MTRVFLSLSLLLASLPAFAGTWTDLWLTPDQQGQRMLDAGEAGKAAKQFQDPRLRAYADVKAGNYDSAAEQLAPLKDVESLYNRGNAFARAGKLKEALASYDAALAKAPDHRDARHNRDLVERQLQKQNQSQNGQGDQGQSGEGDSKNSKDQQGGNDQSGSGQPEQQNGSQKDGSQQSGQQQSGSQQSGSPRNSQQSGARQNGSQQDSPQQNGSQQSDSQRAGSGQPENSRQQPAQGSQQGDSQQRAGQQISPNGQSGTNDNGRDAPAEGQQTDQQQAAAARRDAEAALQRGSASQGRVAGSQDAQKPTTEQALAREQWLRRIPEDPGGLLRRKFLVEHMKKQQQQQEPQQ